MNVLLSTVACFAVLFVVKGEVNVKDGAYHDLVISFSPNVDDKNGKSIVDSLENLLQDTSKVLHTAIGLRIASVTFHLPSTWDTSKWNAKEVVPASVMPEDQRNVIVDDVVDSAFGKRPFALQYGGCGVPGHRLTVPVEFLNADEDYPKGKLLAREWLKYRYGVFDENGFNGDDMYPSYYQIPGTTDIKITECTHPQAEYHYNDTEGNACSLEIPFTPSSCEIHPNEDALNVTSSLMYYHKELRNMEHVCGKEHTHKESTPSKQNILCNGNSIWDILKKSGDFNGTTSDGHQAESEGITFSYTQEVKPRVVVAYEYSENLHDQRQMVVFSLRRFLYALPLGSELGLLRFTDQSTEMLPLAPLTDDGRQVLIPSDFDSTREACPTCALGRAVEVLSDKPQVRSSIVLIVGSNASKVDESLIQKLNALNVCLKIIGFTSEGKSITGYEDLLSSSNCNTLTAIPKEVQGDLIFKQLYENMQDSVSQSPTNIEVSTTTGGIMSHTNPIEIIMDSRADKFTLWTARYIADGIDCTSGDTNVSLSAGIESNTIASYTFEPVEDRVICKLRYPKTPKVFVQVEKTSKPGGYIQGEVWVHDPSQSEEQMPVTIYAKVYYGSYPVQDAKVKAKVFGKDGEVHELELFDNGRGNPDITQHDGIYSRYFVNFTIEGEHMVLVTVSDDAFNAQLGKKGQDRCCGSRVDSSREQAPLFIKTFRTTFQAKKKPDGGYKPSRVLDLRVSGFDPSSYIAFNWTAPGGEADNGNASSYEFLLFCKFKDCSEHGKLPEWIAFNGSFPTPKISGEDESIILHFGSGTPNNKFVSFGLRSVNYNGQFSDISNLVEIKLGDIFQPVIDQNKGAGISQAAIRAIVGGSVLGLFLLICIAVVVHNTSKRIRGPRARDIPKSERINLGFSESTKDLNNIDARDGPTTNGAFPVVLYTHDQIKGIKKKEIEPPLYGANVGPKPWLSLDSFPVKSNKADDHKSHDSVISLPIIEANQNEMKQLDTSSQTSELHLEKVAKF